MSDSSTVIEIENSKFDLAAIGNWAEDHVEIFLLFAFIAFIFFIFRKGAFAERFLEFRLKSKELDAKRLDDSRVVADILRKQLGPDAPLLPFDEWDTEEQ